MPTRGAYCQSKHSKTAANELRISQNRQNQPYVVDGEQNLDELLALRLTSNIPLRDLKTQTQVTKKQQESSKILKHLLKKIII